MLIKLDNGTYLSTKFVSDITPELQPENYDGSDLVETGRYKVFRSGVPGYILISTLDFQKLIEVLEVLPYGD